MTPVLQALALSISDYTLCHSFPCKSSSFFVADGRSLCCISLVCGTLLSPLQSMIVARALMSEIITGLWIGVSLWGSYAGWRGYNAEAKLPPQNARIPQRVVTPEVYKWKKTHRTS